jgi:hypothetical protein
LFFLDDRVRFALKKTMKKAFNPKWLLVAAAAPVILISCSKDHPSMPATSDHTITIENVLQSQPLVESGTFQQPGQLINPGASSSFTFSAAKG